MKKTTLLIGLALLQIPILNSQTVSTFTYTGAIQTFTVPACVSTITVEAFGAQGGGGGGLGARMRGDFAVTPGMTINVVVGQMGLDQVGGNAQNSSGGGGGSFVYTTGNVLFIAAGGGGGKCLYTGSVPLPATSNGDTTSFGGADSDGVSPGGTGGNGGAVGVFSTWNDGGGGAGWLTAGGDANLGGKNAPTWAGGNPYCGGGGGGCGGYGGFGGGGGGGNDYGGGGGGGGYSGGGGGNDPDHGGGGGSYNGGTNKSNTGGVQSGNGLVTITYTGGIPASPASILGSTTICASTSGTFSITSVPGATSYTWTVPSGTVITSGQGTNSINVNFGTTSGTVSVTADNTCGSSAPTTIAITINPLPTVTASATSTSACLSDGNITLTGTPASGSWSGPGVTGNSFNPNAAGLGAQTLTYSYTDVNACSNTASVVITVNVCANTVETSLQNGVNVYPNPTNGTFTIAINANVGDMQIELTDMQGRVVFSSTEHNVQPGFTKQIPMNEFSNGVYLLHLTSDSEKRTEKITLQK